MSNIIQLVHNQEGELTYALDDQGQLFVWESKDAGFGVTRYQFVACQNNAQQFRDPLDALSTIICSEPNGARPDNLADAISKRLSNTNFEIKVLPNNNWEIRCQASQRVAIFTLGNKIAPDKPELVYYQAYLTLGTQGTVLKIAHRESDNVIWVSKA